MNAETLQTQAWTLLKNGLRDPGAFAAIAQVIVEAKTELEKIREQVQNVE